MGREGIADQETDRQTDTERDRDRERARQRQTARQKQTETERICFFLLLFVFFSWSYFRPLKTLANIQAVRILLDSVADLNFVF